MDNGCSLPFLVAGSVLGFGCFPKENVNIIASNTVFVLLLLHTVHMGSDFVSETVVTANDKNEYFNVYKCRYICRWVLD